MFCCPPIARELGRICTKSCSECYASENVITETKKLDSRSGTDEVISGLVNSLRTEFQESLMFWKIKVERRRKQTRICEFETGDNYITEECMLEQAVYSSAIKVANKLGW